jgi:adenylosuccinate lyase
VGRQEAHELVRSSAMVSHETGKHLKDVLLANPEIVKYLNEEDVANLVDPDKYIGTAVEQVEAVVAKLQKKQ